MHDTTPNDGTLAGISGVRLVGTDGTTGTAGSVDVAFDGGTVSAVLPHDPTRSAATDGSAGDWLDLRGYTVLPATADPHAHLDKSRSWDVVNPPVGDLPGAVAAWSAAAGEFTEDDILDRARSTARTMLAAGTTAVRTHVDVYPGGASLRGIRAVDRLREELAGMMTLQIVALVPPSTPDAEVRDLVAGALDAGADLVGGAPHLAGEPLAQTDRLLDTAEALDVGCDLHIDEYTDRDPDHVQTIHRYAERVAGWPAGRDRAAGHCCRLAVMDPDDLGTTAAELVAADIPVIALPATNLYLQDTGSRAVAPLSALRSHGVRVAAGGDNVADPFNPTGRGDALETAALLVTAAHQTPDRALDLTGPDARSVMGLPAAGPVAGAVADLLCLRTPDDWRAGSAASLISAAPADRAVIAGGRLVARTTTQTTFPELDLRPVA